jgi:hypothetical protein
MQKIKLVIIGLERLIDIPTNKQDYSNQRKCNDHFLFVLKMRKRKLLLFLVLLRPVELLTARTTSLSFTRDVVVFHSRH